MSRQFIFRHYPWIAAIAALVGVVGVSANTAGDRPSMIGSVVAGVLAFCYFAQTQKLAEMSLFKELFTDFNRRYDDLNELLTALRSPVRLPTPRVGKPSSTTLTCAPKSTSGIQRATFTMRCGAPGAPVWSGTLTANPSDVFGSKKARRIRTTGCRLRPYVAARVNFEMEPTRAGSERAAYLPRQPA